MEKNAAGYIKAVGKCTGVDECKIEGGLLESVIAWLKADATLTRRIYFLIKHMIG